MGPDQSEFISNAGKLGLKWYVSKLVLLLFKKWKILYLTSKCRYQEKCFKIAISELYMFIQSMTPSKKPILTRVEVVVIMRK